MGHHFGTTVLPKLLFSITTNSLKLANTAVDFVGNRSVLVLTCQKDKGRQKKGAKLYLIIYIYTRMYVGFLIIFSWQPNQTHSTTTYHDFTSSPLHPNRCLLQVDIGNLNQKLAVTLQGTNILLTEEILHHLGCTKPCIINSGILTISTGAGFLNHQQYPTWGKGKSSLKKAFKKGYVSSQEGKNQLWPTLFDIK